MKKSVILVLLLFVFFATFDASADRSEKPGEPKSENEVSIDHSIVGKWEYVKTIRPDGSEIVELSATEHYYSDGTLLYVNIHLTPQPINEFSNTPEEIKSNFKKGYGGIATYKIEKGRERDMLTYKRIACTQMEKIGNSVSVEINVDKDTLIFYSGGGTKYILKRVSD